MKQNTKARDIAVNVMHNSHINAEQNDTEYTNAGFNQRFKLHEETEHIGSTYP